MIKKTFFFLCVAILFSAWHWTKTTDFIFEGWVTDNNGDPLIGANVLIKGTGIGTVTDIDGYYKLSYPESSATLVITYAGYESKEIKASGGKKSNVVLA